MSRIIIYDNKNILIADLYKTEVNIERNSFNAANYKNPVTVPQKEYSAIFKEYKIIHSISLQKQLRKIEKVFKYHKEKSENNKKINK